MGSMMDSNKNTLVPDEEDEGYLQNYVIDTLRNPKIVEEKLD